MTEDNADQTAQNDGAYNVKLPSGRTIFDSQSKEGRFFVRPQGQKSFLSTNSGEEDKQVETLSRERRDLLSEPRAQRLSDLAVAEWIPDRDAVVLLRIKRGILEYMGRTLGDETVLHPFEALFLMESCQLQLLCREIPLSAEEGYELLLKDEDDLERFQVYGHLLRAGYTVVLHQGRIGVTSYEKKIGLDKYSLRKSRVTVSDSSSDSDVVCLDDDEDDSDSSEIEVLDVVPPKQPKLEEVNSCDGVNDGSDECEVLLPPDDAACEEIPSAQRNGNKEADVVFLSSTPSTSKGSSSFAQEGIRADQASDDCVVIDVDPKPSRLLEFPKFDGHRAVLMRPPPHLLPRTVFMSKAHYTLDMDSVQRECRDSHMRLHGRTRDDGMYHEGHYEAWSQNQHHSRNWRGQWYGGFESAQYGESSYSHEERISERWGRDRQHQGRERDHQHRRREWEHWNRGSRNSYSSSHSNDRSPHGHVPSPPSSSSWSYNSRRWSTPASRPCRDEDSYVSVIPKVDCAVSNWAELKAEASRRLNVSTLATGDGASLWKGKVKPLVMPSSDLSIGGIMSQLSVIREVDVVHGKNLGTTEPKTKLKIDFDVYLPGTVFRKSCPSLPEHRVVCTRVTDGLSDDPVLSRLYDARMRDGPPRLSDMAALQGLLADDVPLVFATMDSGNILLFAIDGIAVPNFSPKL